jgi:hypothetical protein
VQHCTKTAYSSKLVPPFKTNCKKIPGYKQRVSLTYRLPVKLQATPPLQGINMPIFNKKLI